MFVPMNLGELQNRTHELPDPSEPLILAGPDASQGANFLRSVGRRSLVESDVMPGRLGGRLWSPNPFLVAEVAGRAPGKALDLGCGSGRDSAALVAMGWQVTALDQHEAALERTKGMVQQYVTDPSARDRLNCLRANLDQEQLPEGEWDLVISFFLLHREALRQASKQLRIGGVLLLEAFTDEHAQRWGKPASPSRRVRPGEFGLDAAIGDLVVTSRAEGLHGVRHTVRLRAERLP